MFPEDRMRIEEEVPAELLVVLGELLQAFHKTLLVPLGARDREDERHEPVLSSHGPGFDEVDVV